MRVVFRYIACLALLPAVAMADVRAACDELWFARNAMLNEAGYCFTTRLGQSLFDNTDCTTRQPIVGGDVSEQISLIQRLEQNPPFFEDETGSCQIDTSQSELSEVRYMGLRQRVTFQPATEGASGGCINYMGNDFLVFSAPDPGAQILGRVEKGFSFSLSHLPWRDWNFAIVWQDIAIDEPVAIGWYRQDIGENCALFAG